MNHSTIMRRTPSPCPANYGSVPACEHTVNTDPSDVHPIADDTDRKSNTSLHSTGSFRVGESEDEMDSFHRSQENTQEPRNHCGPSSAASVEKMRRYLKFFFMNPCQKWRAKGKYPWKMILQVVKIIVVTIQLTTFGVSRSSHVNFMEKSTVAFKHLYVKGWEPSFETLPYPPATGQFAIYTIPEFYEHVNYALRRYNQTEKIAIGTYSFDNSSDIMPPMRMCKEHYQHGRIFAFNETFSFNSKKVVECFDLQAVEKYDPSTGTNISQYDVETYLRQINQTLYFDRIISISLKLSLKTVHLKGLSRLNMPDCFRFLVEIVYENHDHNGQMLISLNVDEIPLDCEGDIAYPGSIETLQALQSVFDVLVIIVSFCSSMLCMRSIYRAHKLQHRTVKFFKVHFHKDLTVHDKLEFVNFWYIVMFINDILTIVGSMFKILIENKISHNYEACGVLLGTGSLLVWFGVLRYLGFFEKYNILIITMKRAFPNVLRFLVCAVVFYLGFTFCGWVVLGPYHLKFRSLSSTSECLFALVNGDELYMTFSALTNANVYIWWYCRIYLYVFISLFIYVVLSVFISVIMDTYETIKHWYEHGFPKSDLFEFIEQCEDDASSPLYRAEDDSRFGCACCLTRCFPRASDPEQVSERSSLLASH